VLIYCLIWVLLVLCGCWNVCVDKLLYGKSWFCVAVGMCVLINCLIWEVLVLCGCWNVCVDKLSYTGSAGIVWLLECVC
jgi:hypothetical protein